MSDYFGHLDRLWLLLLVPLLYVFYRYTDGLRRAALERFARAEILSKLLATLDFSRRRNKRVLLLIGVALLVVCLAQPRLGTTREMAKRAGVDIIVALDVSKSMLAEDLKPSRLERAKLEVRELINRLKGDRIGVMAFAGDAFIACPLTLDYGAARLFLSDIGTDSVGTPGTAIARAIDVARQGFVQKEQKYKVLILVTDGENHGEDPVAAAREAAKEGVIIYAIGLGDPRGFPVPVYDAQGKFVDYKVDRSGQKVNSRLDEETLQKIVFEARGKYFRATTGQMELDHIYEEVKKQEEREIETQQVIEYEERFQPFVAAALLCLVIEALLSERVRARVREEGTEAAS